jgi:hypothetical protein
LSHYGWFGHAQVGQETEQLLAQFAETVFSLGEVALKLLLLTDLSLYILLQGLNLTLEEDGHLVGTKAWDFNEGGQHHQGEG